MSLAGVYLPKSTAIAGSSSSSLVNTSNVPQHLFSADKKKPEHPPLKLHNRSFVLANVSEFEWAAINAKNSAEVLSATTSCLTTLRFSQRTYSHTFIDAHKHQPIVHHELPPVNFCLAEVFLSRAIELECDARSILQSNGVSVFPLSCPFAHESFDHSVSSARTTLQQHRLCLGPGSKSTVATDSPKSSQTATITERPEPSFPECEDNRTITQTACILSPATYGIEYARDKVNVRLQHASPKTVNELRWLLSSIDCTDQGTLFTKIVGTRRGPSSFHIVTDTPVVCHPFKMQDPWRVVWHWLARLPCRDSVCSAYLTAVGSTWCPVPDCIETSWIYSLEIEHRQRNGVPECQIHGTDTGKKSDAFCTCTVLDAAQDYCEWDDALGSLHRKKGFTHFLWDVVAYWRGVFRPLDTYDYDEWIPPNEDLAVMGALDLRQLISNHAGDKWISGHVPLMYVVLSAWKAIAWKSAHLCATPSILQGRSHDVQLIVPYRLRTLDFVLSKEALQRKEEIFVNGYKIIPTSCDDTVKFGIGSAGLFAGAPLFLCDIQDQNNRQRQRWLFDVDVGFTLNDKSLGILFIALYGSNIEARYDDVYARYFLNSCPFGAVADWPRCCYVHTHDPRKQRIIFGKRDPCDCRGDALLSLIKVLDEFGGLLSINCKISQSVLAPSAARPDLIPHLVTTWGGNTSKTRKKHPHPFIGRIRSQSLTPGLYSLRDLGPILPNLTPWDMERLRSCWALFRGEDDLLLEVRHSDTDYTEATTNEMDVDAITMRDSLTIETYSLLSVPKSDIITSGLLGVL